MADVASTITTAASGDLDAVLHVHAEHAGERRCEPPSVRERETWARMMATPDLTVYLAEVDGHVSGTATMMVMANVTYDCDPTAFIEAVVVVPHHRRRGIATAMLQRALTDARRLGCKKVQLLSHKRHASDGAHALYVNLGFEAEAEGFRLYLEHVPPGVRAAADPAV
jgi:GNAT superfamily N-acetyltransferase